MKGLLRFLVFAGLGLALIWVITAGEGLFPAPETPETTQTKPAEHHRPVAEFKQGEGGVSVAPRGRIRIDSARRIEHPDGRLEQRPRYRIESKESEPDETGTYTLSDALITFFENVPRPAPLALIKAKRMTVALVTGAGGFQPKEDQEMLLTGVEISTGPAFRGGRFRLRTDRVLVLMNQDNVLIHSPTPDTPFRLDGEVGGGQLDLKGRGLSAHLPPLGHLEMDPGSVPAESPLAGFGFQGTSEHEGTWRRADEEVQFECQGVFKIERPSPSESPKIAMDQDVRLRRQGSEGVTFLRGDTLRASLRPAPVATGPGSSLGIEWVELSGRPALFGDPRGELRAQNLYAGFDKYGALGSIVAQGMPNFKGSAGERAEVEARCSGPLSLTGLGLPHMPRLPLPEPVLELFIKALPGYQLALTGLSSLGLADPANPVRIEAAEGIDLLLSREFELLSVTGYGKVETSSGGFQALSMDGFTRRHAPWPSLFSRSHTSLGQAEAQRPVRFTLHDSRGDGQGTFKVEGSGLLDAKSGPDGQEILEIVAAGPGGFIEVETSMGQERVLLSGARSLTLTRKEGEKPHLSAQSDWFLPFRLTLPSRGMTAWAWELEGGQDELTLLGAKNQPVLLTSRHEGGGGRAEPLPGRLRLLAPELRLQAAKSRLFALGGVRLYLAGSGLLPGTDEAESRFWARELELRSSRPPSSEGTDSSGPDTAHLIGDVFALIQQTDRITWAGGDELLVFLGQEKALLSGASVPACLIHTKAGEATLRTIAKVQTEPYAREPRAMAEILRTGDERSVAVISRLIQVSADSMVAGHLESGIGARLLLAVGPDQESARVDFIEADSAQPISVKGEDLNFPGYTTLRQGTLGEDGAFIPDPGETSLVCGAMTCRRTADGGNRFDMILGEKGVQFRRGIFQGDGQSLRFAPLTGNLLLDGGGEPCTVWLGERVIRGPRLSVNVFDFTMTTHGFLLESRPPAEAGLKEDR